MGDLIVFNEVYKCCFLGGYKKKSILPLHTHLIHDLLAFFFSTGSNFKYFSLIYSLILGGESRIGNVEDEVKGR